MAVGKSLDAASYYYVRQLHFFHHNRLSSFREEEEVVVASGTATRNFRFHDIFYALVENMIQQELMPVESFS